MFLLLMMMMKMMIMMMMMIIMVIMDRVLHKHLTDCPRQEKSQIGQAKSVLWTYNFQYKKTPLNYFFFFGGGASRMSFGRVFFVLKLVVCLLARMGKW